MRIFSQEVAALQLPRTPLSSSRSQPNLPLGKASLKGVGVGSSSDSGSSGSVSGSSSDGEGDLGALGSPRGKSASPPRTPRATKVSTPRLQPLPIVHSRSEQLVKVDKTSSSLSSGELRDCTFPSLVNWVVYQKAGLLCFNYWNKAKLEFFFNHWHFISKK